MKRYTEEETCAVGCIGLALVCMRVLITPSACSCVNHSAARMKMGVYGWGMCGVLLRICEGRCGRWLVMLPAHGRCTEAHVHDPCCGHAQPVLRSWWQVLAVRVV